MTDSKYFEDTKIQNCVWDVLRFILLTNLVIDLKKLRIYKPFIGGQPPVNGLHVN